MLHVVNDAMSELRRALLVGGRPAGPGRRGGGSGGRAGLAGTSGLAATPLHALRYRAARVDAGVNIAVSESTRDMNPFVGLTWRD
jgi:hypothetical protein